MPKSREVNPIIFTSIADGPSSFELYTRAAGWVDESSNLSRKCFNINVIGTYNVVCLEVRLLSLLSQVAQRFERLRRIQQWAPAPSSAHP